MIILTWQLCKLQSSEKINVLLMVGSYEDKHKRAKRTKQTCGMASNETEYKILQAIINSLNNGESPAIILFGILKICNLKFS